MYLLDLSSNSLTLPPSWNGYELRKATEKQVIQMFEDSYDEWGVNYGPREAYMKSLLTMHTGRFCLECSDPYILVDENSPIDTLDFLAHCWIYRREALWKPSKKLSTIENIIEESEREDTLGSKFQVLPIWSISIVFVPLRYRGKGYSKLLLQFIQNVLVCNNIPFCSLYSDIEGDLYAKYHFYDLPKVEWIYSLPNPTTGPMIDDRNLLLSEILYLKDQTKEIDMYDIQFIDFYNIENLVIEERKAILYHMSIMKTSNDEKPVLNILPIAGNIEWDWTDMSLEYASLTHNDFEGAKRSLLCGIKFSLKNETESNNERNYPTYILWSSDFVTKELVVIRVTLNSPNQVQFSLNVLKIVAQHYHHEDILFWHPKYIDLYYGYKEEDNRKPITDILMEGGYSLNPENERKPCLAIQNVSPVKINEESSFWSLEDVRKVNWIQNECMFWV